MRSLPITVVGCRRSNSGRAMRDPVTTISVRLVSDSAAATGVCCASAGMFMAVMHTQTENIIVNLFTGDLTPIGFPILIVVSLKVSQRLRCPEALKHPLCYRDMTRQTNAAPHRADDSRRATSGNENGMRAAPSVMREAGHLPKMAPS